MELETLKKELALAEKNIEAPAIKGNPELLKSAKTRISILKTQVGISEKKMITQKPEVTTEKKVDIKVKAPKVSKEPKAKKEKVVVPDGKFKEGDLVSWTKRDTGKKMTGNISRIRLYKGDKNKVLVDIKTKDGKQHTAYASKIEKA